MLEFRKQGEAGEVESGSDRGPTQASGRHPNNSEKPDKVFKVKRSLGFRLFKSLRLLSVIFKGPLYLPVGAPANAHFPQDKRGPVSYRAVLISFPVALSHLPPCAFA